MGEVTEIEKQQQWTAMHLLIAALLQLVLVHIAYRIERRKSMPYISTSSWAILFGIMFGAVLTFISKSRASYAGLDPELLFFALLPPIILEAGFNTQRKGFFSNFWTISLLAGLGTVIATLATGFLLLWLGAYLHLITALHPAEALLYGALISAIDPVSTLVVLKKAHAPSRLFNLLFGESVLNDAVCLVMFSLFQQAVLEEDDHPLTWRSSANLALNLVGIGVGSILLAAVICYASAFLLRRSDVAMKQHPTFEISIILLSAYASYVAGQSFGLSGLLAVFFSGVLIRHYHMHNISKSSVDCFSHLLSTLAFLAENFMYIYLGVSVFADKDTLEWDWPFVLVSIAVILVARAVNTFPLCMVANMFHPAERRIPFKYMVVIWFAGLRGAIAFALALNIRTSRPTNHAAIMRASSLFTVFASTIILGMATGPLLCLLGLSRQRQRTTERNGDDDGDGEERARSRCRGGSTSSVESTPLLPRNRSTVSIHNLWVAMDEKHLKPIFGGCPRPPCDSAV